jgi:hypothetical protein
MVDGGFFKFLSTALSWILRAFFYVREKFATAGAPGITFVVRAHERPANAKFKCKILVDIKNDTVSEQPIRLSAAYFVFNKNSPLKADPQWSREYKTGRFHLYFFSHETGQHTLRYIDLKPGQATNTWIGIDPKHKDDDIAEAVKAENIGRLYFRMTRWTDSGSPKTRWVYRGV